MHTRRQALGGVRAYLTSLRGDARSWWAGPTVWAEKTARGLEGVARFTLSFMRTSLTELTILLELTCFKEGVRNSYLPPLGGVFPLLEGEKFSVGSGSSVLGGDVFMDRRMISRSCHWSGASGWLLTWC